MFEFVCVMLLGAGEYDEESCQEIVFHGLTRDSVMQEAIKHNLNRFSLGLDALNYCVYQKVKV